MSSLTMGYLITVFTKECFPLIIPALLFFPQHWLCSKKFMRVKSSFVTHNCFICANAKSTGDLGFKYLVSLINHELFAS